MWDRLPHIQELKRKKVYVIYGDAANSCCNRFRLFAPFENVWFKSKLHGTANACSFKTILTRIESSMQATTPSDQQHTTESYKIETHVNT